ncbi:MAG: hypothetical protein K0U82_00235, partial [Planctomycetes bacterium]|nr:hypothetical protein [Planctomycetota bacterium]
CFNTVICILREKSDAAEKFENCFTTALIGNAFFAGRVVLRLPYKGNLEKSDRGFPMLYNSKAFSRKV